MPARGRQRHAVYPRRPASTRAHPSPAEPTGGRRCPRHTPNEVDRAGPVNIGRSRRYERVQPVVMRKYSRTPHLAGSRLQPGDADLAGVYLRAGRSFRWNATNVSRQQRDLCVGLAASYHARVEIVALEAPPTILRSRNQARADPVPDRVIERLIGRWQTPDVTEAHAVRWIDTAIFSNS